MSDFDFGETDRGAEAPADEDLGGTSPLGPKAVGMLVVFLALVVLLWVLFARSGDGGGAPGLPTATSRPGATVVSGLRTARAASTKAGATAGAGTAMEGTISAGTTTPTAAAVLSAALTTGGFAKVQGTDGYGLRLRFGQGGDYATIRIVDEGETLKVTGGPDEAEGSRWWRLQDRYGNIGWAADTYLVAGAAPTGWSPPMASPTFPPGSSASLAPEASP